MDDNGLVLNTCQFLNNTTNTSPDHHCAKVLKDIFNKIVAILDYYRKEEQLTKLCTMYLYAELMFVKGNNYVVLHYLHTSLLHYFP